MIYVFGGAYQGKTDYAREMFDIQTVCDCSGGSFPDFTSDAVSGTEGFVLTCVREGIEAAEWFEERKNQWKDKVIILTDVSQGVVPVDKEMRAFREMNGRLGIYLSKEAGQVHRVFCGIGKRIK